MKTMPLSMRSALQAWLSTASNGEIAAGFRRRARAAGRPAGGADARVWEDRCDFADPRSWAVFSYSGA